MGEGQAFFEDCAIDNDPNKTIEKYSKDDIYKAVCCNSMGLVARNAIQQTR